MSNIAQIQSLLGADADSLLNHSAKVSRDAIHAPSPSGFSWNWDTSASSAPSLNAPKRPGGCTAVMVHSALCS